MKPSRMSWTIISLGLLLSLTSCRTPKSAIPPHEMFAEAEKLRANGYLLEAAKQYDALVEAYAQSELAPEALYQSGICKYTLTLHCPGEREFRQRQDGLSDVKKQQYQQCLDYMEKQKKAFAYDETNDKYVYRGTEFAAIVDKYPSSNLVDDAAFQLVYTQLTTQQMLKTLTLETALQRYAAFCVQYPQSPYREKGVEDVIKIASEHPELITNPQTVAEAYQQLAQAVGNLPALSKLSYLIGQKLLKDGQQEQAAKILGMSGGIIGRGTVETQQTRLNIRKGGGLEFPIVAKAEKGETLLLLEKTGEWYKVQLQDGTVGYAHQEFIKPVQ